MQQPDNCGCGSIRTPTLAELLAVTRRKPLPTMRVRERRPPPVRVGASMRGWMRWGLIDRRGREVKGGEGPNLILDQGLDQVAAMAVGQPSSATFPIILACAVGTDNTAPSVSDTALGTEVGRTSTTYASNEMTRTSSGVYEMTRYIEFDYAEANGNLTEWGFSYDATGPGLLFNRALFLDGGGSPEVVTKTTDYKLRIIYTLEVTLSPVALTPGAFTVTGVGTVNGDYTLVGRSSFSTAARQAPDLSLFQYLAQGDPGAADGNVPESASIQAYEGDLSGVTYATDMSVTGVVGTATEVSVAPDAYTPGSFTRTGGVWKWETDVGNYDPIRAFTIVGDSVGALTPDAYVGYAFDLDLADEFTKDDEHTLTIGVPTVTWGRGS